MKDMVRITPRDMVAVALHPLKAGDAETLRRLLKEGRERKESIDTEWKEPKT